MASEKKLNLQGENLKTITQKTFIPYAAHLHKYAILDLDYNSVRQIDSDAFVKLKNVRVVHLAANELSAIEKEIFEALGNLTSLKSLDFGSNLLEKVEPQVFEKLTNLTRLDLSNNQLTEIECNMFEFLKNLEWLDLKENKIEKINSHAFTQLTSLKYLKLSSNRLTAIDPDTFKPFAASIGLIDVRKNLFNFPAASYINENTLRNNNANLAELEIDIENYKKFFSKSTYGYKSNFNDFSSQFNLEQSSNKRRANKVVYNVKKKFLYYVI